ncbi:MAG: hypothetical protein AAF810_15295 [Cyanobacteria bacterium P01_D01_bin.36]
MPRAKILQPNQSYTFRSYFEMSYEPDDILAEFGCSLHRLTFSFPELDPSKLDISTADKSLQQSVLELKKFIERRLPNVRLTTEAARREILISPLVLALMDYVQIQLRIEYSVKVSEQLKGSLDYYLQSQHNLLVIEAKNADLTRGFTQLAVELIALDQWTNSEEPILYGAVSTGDVWQFGRLRRAEKKIEQDLTLYTVPADLDKLFRVLLTILTD